MTTFAFNALDPLFCDGGAFGPDKTFPMWKFPASYYLNAPVDVFDKVMHVIAGAKSDEGAIDQLTGLPAARGLCSCTYLGMDGLPTGPGGTAELWGRFNICLFASYSVLGLYGADLGVYGIGAATSNGAAPSVITFSNSPDLSKVPTDGTWQITIYTTLKGIITSQITAVNNVAKTVTVNNTIATVDATAVDFVIKDPNCPNTRVKIDINARNGVDVMVFGYPNYVRSTTYEDIMGSDGEVYRVTDIWVTGPLLDMHLNGTVTLAVNMIGIEDQGDGTGLPITDFYTWKYWWLVNCVMANTKAPGGIGFVGKYPQTDGDIAAIGAAWADGVYKVRGSSFVAAQAASVLMLGGRGLQISACFDTATPLRDVMQRFADNSFSRSGINEHGQVFESLFNPFADTTTWPRLEHVSRFFGSVTRTRPQDQIENVVQGRCDWDSDGQKYRNGTVTLPSATGISHNKGIRKYSKLIDGTLIADPVMWQNVLQRRLAYAQDGPVYVTLTGDIGLVDYPLGSGVLVTSIMGPGALGYVDQPMIILRKRHGLDSHLVDYTLLDVGPSPGMGILVPAANRSVFSATTAIAARFSDNTAIAGVFKA